MRTNETILATTGAATTTTRIYRFVCPHCGYITYSRKRVALPKSCPACSYKAEYKQDKSTEKEWDEIER